MLSQNALIDLGLTNVDAFQDIPVMGLFVTMWMSVTASLVAHMEFAIT